MKVVPYIHLYLNQEPLYKCICGHRFRKDNLPTRAIRRGIVPICPNCGVEMVFQNDEKKGK